MDYNSFLEKAVDMIMTAYNELYSDGYLLTSEDVVCLWMCNDSLVKKGVFYTVLDNELLYEVNYDSSRDGLNLTVFRKLTYTEYDL